jgi:signal transduction histidine kinase
MLLGSKNTIIAASKEGGTMDDLHRTDCLIMQQPLSDTGWRLALVCPEKDIFKGYNSMVTIIISLIVFGLLVMLAFSYFIIRKTMEPVEKLTLQTSDIAEGHFDSQIEPSTRIDEVGRLQNAFHTMQQQIASHVAQLESACAKTEQKNEELKVATTLARESDRKKTAFIQDMFHQIRTPLNIISGFTQVLSSSIGELSEEEIADITSRMMSSAKSINHISKILTASAGHNNLTGETTTFSCNALCREAAASVKLNVPDKVEIKVESNVPDTFTIHTNREALLSILDELLDNANKFTLEGCITINCSLENADIIISVSNTGAKIPVEARDHIFIPFTKLDAFTEGIGLGLTLSRHIAHQLGGDITYDDTYDNGTRFIVKIPINLS